MPCSELSALLKETGAKAHVTCFWFGRAGAEKPTLAPLMTKVFKLLPADVETDFAVEESPSGRRVA
jgi:hypothetical protein